MSFKSSFGADQDATASQKKMKSGTTPAGLTVIIWHIPLNAESFSSLSLMLRNEVHLSNLNLYRHGSLVSVRTSLVQVKDISISEENHHALFSLALVWSENDHTSCSSARRENTWTSSIVAIIEISFFRSRCHNIYVCTYVYIYLHKYIYVFT